MTGNDCCSKCSGTGEMQEIVARPVVRYAKLAVAKFITCDACGGTGKRKG